VNALRSAIFVIWMILITLVMGVLFSPWFLFPRRWVLWPFHQWCRLLLGGMRVICGIKAEIRGRERLPEGACLVAPKHLAMWDTVILNLVLKDPAIILKKELMMIPIYGWYARKLGMIAIDRDGKASTLRTMTNAAKQALADGRPVVIFPEGTRSEPGLSAGYKPGVAGLYRSLDVPCVPIALTSGLHWPARSWTWAPGTIVLEVLDPIPPGLKRAEFMRELETRNEEGTDRLLREAGFDPEAARAAAGVSKPSDAPQTAEPSA